MKVKFCGMTHEDDVAYAAHLGVDYIGMIFSEQSRRCVSLPLAKRMTELAKGLNVEPVGVFVDHTADQIHSICEKTNIKTVQLHGRISRQGLPYLIEEYSIIYAIPSEDHQNYFLPPSVVSLYDHSIGGTGMPFDWMSFSPPKNTQWILAGGLNCHNVAEAIALLNPNGVDVASGIEFPNSTRKNPVLMKDFMQIVKNAKENI